MRDSEYNIDLRRKCNPEKNTNKLVEDNTLDQTTCNAQMHKSNAVNLTSVAPLHLASIPNSDEFTFCSVQFVSTCGLD